MQGPTRKPGHVGEHEYRKGGGLGQLSHQVGKVLNKIHTSQATMQHAISKGITGSKELKFGARKMTPLAEVLQKLDTSKVPGRAGKSLEETKVSEQTGKQQAIKYPGKQQPPAM